MQWLSQSQLIIRISRFSFTDDIVTTQEVLTEYLNLFSSGPQHLRRNAAAVTLLKAMQAVLRDPTVRIVPRSDGSFHAGLD